MVIQCLSCKGLLRYDPAVCNAQGFEQIRCPHCGRVGTIQANDAVDQENFEAKPSNCAHKSDGVAQEEFEGKAMPLAGSDLLEQEIPEENFQESRVMGWMATKSGRKSTGPEKNWLKWILVSIVIVGFFALLVNLILPGPTGHKFFGGVKLQDNSTGR